MASLIPALGVTAHAYSTSHPNTHVNTGNQRNDVVAIAETQLGYAENPGTKYGAWWQQVTGSSHNFVNEAWCVMFALWCTDQAGCTAAWSGMSALSSSLMSKYQNGQNGCTAYKFGSGYMPRPGDLIFVGYKGNSGYTNHVGMVVSVTDTTINTIEGNYNNKVSRSSYSLSTGLRTGSGSRAIVYFGVPAYTNDTTGEMTGPVITPTPEQPEDYPDTGINYKTKLTSSLNVRSDANISASVIKALPAGTEVTIVDEKADGTGRMWGRLSTGGWISLRYTTTGNSTDPVVPGEMEIEPYNAKVNCDILLIRTVPGTSAATDGQLYLGNAVTIVATANVNSIEWGKLKDGGWVATKYLTKEEATTPPEDEAPGRDPNPPTEPVLFAGTVNASTLNVRNAAGLGEIIDLLRNGESVNIYETQTLAGGKLWGRCDKGWIYLGYVDYTLPETGTGTPDAPGTGTGTGTTTPPASGVACKVTGVRVNIRKGAGTQYDIIDNLGKDTAITIVETLNVGGSIWGKLSTGGWISINYTDYRTVAGGTTGGTTTQAPITGVQCTVTGNLVNVRKGAGTTYTVTSYASKNTVITIVETKNVEGKPWGRLSTGGWISLAFTDYDRVMNPQPETPESTTPETGTTPDSGTTTPDTGTTTPPATTGSVACKVTGNLVNVRAGAGTAYGVINSLPNGTAITVTETTTINGKLWGKLSTGGWMCLIYTDYQKVSAEQGTTAPGTGTTTPGTGTTTPDAGTTTPPADDELPGGVTEVTPEGTAPGTGTTTPTPAPAYYISGTVSAASINVRKSAGYSTVVAYLPQGATVTVTETKFADGVLWGHVAQGWVSMSLITTNASASTGITYTVKQGVNIRSGVGTSTAVTGAAYTGTAVTIVSFSKASNGKTWGQLKDGGWICMDYAMN